MRVDELDKRRQLTILLITQEGQPAEEIVIYPLKTDDVRATIANTLDSRGVPKSPEKKYR